MEKGYIFPLSAQSAAARLALDRGRQAVRSFDKVEVEGPLDLSRC